MHAWSRHFRSHPLSPIGVVITCIPTRCLVLFVCPLELPGGRDLERAHSGFDYLNYPVVRCRDGFDYTHRSPTSGVGAAWQLFLFTLCDSRDPGVHPMPAVCDNVSRLSEPLPISRASRVFPFPKGHGSQIDDCRTDPKEKRCPPYQLGFSGATPSDFPDVGV